MEGKGNQLCSAELRLRRGWREGEREREREGGGKEGDVKRGREGY